MPSGPPPWSTYWSLSPCWAAAACSCASASAAAPTLTTTSRCVSVRAPQDESNHRHSPRHKPLAVTDFGREVRFLNAVDCNTDCTSRRALAISLHPQNLLFFFTRWMRRLLTEQKAHCLTNTQGEVIAMDIFLYIYINKAWIKFFLGLFLKMAYIVNDFCCSSGHPGVWQVTVIHLPRVLSMFFALTSCCESGLAT